MNMPQYYVICIPCLVCIVVVYCILVIRQCGDGYGGD